MLQGKNKQRNSFIAIVHTRSASNSLLSLLLFNIGLNDLFYLAECANICNFAVARTF